jgi:hypothetical protein
MGGLSGLRASKTQWLRAFASLRMTALWRLLRRKEPKMDA